MSDMAINEQLLREALGGLAEIGPSAETIQTAIDAGFVSPEFTPVPQVQPPTGDGGTGDDGTGGTPTVTNTFFSGSGANRKRVTVYSDGSADTVDDPEEEPPPPVEDGAGDARAIITNKLVELGLGELADYTYKEIIIGKGIRNAEAALFQLRDQPAYQRRFAANAARIKKGLPELDAATYLALEEQYRETLRSALGPDMFEVYNEPKDFQALLEGDVSNAELNDRINQGYRAVADADPEVKRQMQVLYGVTDQQLVGYFLDPERASTVLTRQARAAQIAARGAEQGGIQLTGALAEDLARRGITEAEAQRGFQEIGALGELTQTFAGETPLTQQQIVEQQFGVNVQAQQELERRRKLRTGEFAGGGQFTRTTGATSGAIETGAGTAQ